MNVDALLATRTRNIQASAIREILKVAAQPDMISFGGGLPAPESFPLDLMPELMERVLSGCGARAFQYDQTEGFGPLREALTGFCQTKGVPARAEEIFISSGSQGGLDALGKIFITKGDAVAVESPTYLGALQAFNAYQPSYINMETDGDGLIPESLEDVLENRKVKFVYLVPTFQNPTGRTLPLERRRRVADIIRRYDALLVEDDPYGDLRYRGSPLPSIKSLAPENVIYAGTFSKIFAPGLRIGFLVTTPDIGRWLVLAKQGVDLHTSTLTQALAAEYLDGGFLERHLPRIIQLYAPRQAAMLESLERHFPSGFEWSRPEGGMFVWAEGPPGLDTHDVNRKSIEEGVAFVPGRYFFTEPGSGCATMRLNFTNSDEDTIRKGIRILAGVVEREL